MVLKIITLIAILVGVIVIFDARQLSLKWFSFGDQNEATSGLKILGFLIAILGGIVYYNIM